MSARLLVCTAALLVGCGGAVDPSPADLASSGAGADCGIHESISWPTYFANETAPSFAVGVGDAGAVERCVADDSGAPGFYLCAPL